MMEDGNLTSGMIPNASALLCQYLGLYNVTVMMEDGNLTSGMNPHLDAQLCQSHLTYMVLPTLYTLMFLTGFPGNVLALWVFVFKIPDKTPTHIYLINLGVSNLVLCLIMPFLAVYYAQSSNWAMDHPVCKLAVSGLTPVLHTNITLGMINLTWVALSRCATLVKNTHANRPSRVTTVLPAALLHKLCRKRFAWVVCFATWALIITGLIPTMMSYSPVTKQANTSHDACYSVKVEIGNHDTESTMAIVIAGNVAIFFLCYLVVLGSYVAVARHIIRVGRRTAILDRHRVYSRVCRNIVVIQVVLTLCLLPHHTFKAYFLALNLNLNSPVPSVMDPCHPLSVHVEVKNSLLCLAVLRCSTDPITYFLLDRTFHRHIVTLLGRKPPSKCNQSSGSILDGRTSQASKVNCLVVSPERMQGSHEMLGRLSKCLDGSQPQHTL